MGVGATVVGCAVGGKDVSRGDVGMGIGANDVGCIVGGRVVFSGDVGKGVVARIEGFGVGGVAFLPTNSKCNPHISEGGAKSRILTYR
jgi:hypothetical protein